MAGLLNDSIIACVTLPYCSMSFSQAEEACKSNNGVVAYISADLLAAFFKTTNYPEADMIYWLATKSDVAHG